MNRGFLLEAVFGCTSHKKCVLLVKYLLVYGITLIYMVLTLIRILRVYVILELCLANNS